MTTPSSGVIAPTESQGPLPSVAAVAAGSALLPYGRTLHEWAGKARLVAWGAKDTQAGQMLGMAIDAIVWAREVERGLRLEIQELKAQMPNAADEGRPRS